MKTKFYLLILSTLLVVTSCELDNFDEPDAIFTGRIMYNGEAIPVARNQVRFELWQPEYETPAPIDVAIAQDGSFSSRLFSGKYELRFLQGEGPFKAPTNAINIELSGGKQMDIEVTPYHLIRNLQFSHSSGTISATCSVDQILTGADAKDVERVVLVINRTQFVDANSGSEGSIAQVDATDISNLSSLDMSVEIPIDPQKPDQDYMFARIGVKMIGVEDMIYSQVEKIAL